MARGFWGVLRRQFVPLRARFEDPQQGVKDLAVVLAGSASPVRSFGWFGNQGLDDGPLGIGEVHARQREGGVAWYLRFFG